MNNTNTAAPEAALLSEQIAAQIEDRRTRRDELNAEADKTRAKLEAARGAIQLSKPKTLDEATTLQARVTVLTDAVKSLDETIATFEAERDKALETERRDAARAELARLRGELERENLNIKARAIEGATRLQTLLDEILEGQQRSFQFAVQANFAQDEIGQTRGPLDGHHNVTDAALNNALVDAGTLDIALVQGFVFTLERLRQSRHIEKHGINIVYDGPNPAIANLGIINGISSAPTGEGNTTIEHNWETSSPEIRAASPAQLSAAWKRAGSDAMKNK